MPEDLEMLLSQRSRSSSIVLICATPDDPSVAIELAMEGGDWEWAGRALMRSLAVPRIVAGAGSDVVQVVIEHKEFGESEPLLLAAAAVAHSWVDIAEFALARAGAELAETAEPEITDVLSLAVLNMAMSRLRDEPAAGLAQARHITELLAKLNASARAHTPELTPLIDYYVAGFELSMGNLEAAKWRLERGAGPLQQLLNGDINPAEQLVRANCAGQLSWIDAFTGALRRATRHATALLTDRQADSGEIGVKFAQLATVWTHLERLEIEQARQRLDHAQSTSSDNQDPLLAAAQLLTEARLAIVADEPDTAIRSLKSAAKIDLPLSDWFADQFTITTADAWLVAGEPGQAIATLDAESGLESGGRELILARALQQVGKVPDAESILARMPSDPAAISLATQVQQWLLVAEIVFEQGNRERAARLVDRALRIATREALRTTVARAGEWLRSFVARDAYLSYRHSAFLASVPESAALAVDHRWTDPNAYDALFVVPLTVRETDVLKRLAAFCSNEEIADDLVLSLNTIKTHMRSLFQKLSVTRRADAVRRGRALGLC